MTSTMKLRVLKPVFVYRPGTILPIVPRGQAIEWIRMGIAEEVAEEPAVESAAVEVRTEKAAIKHRRNKRG